VHAVSGKGRNRDFKNNGRHRPCAKWRYHVIEMAHVATILKVMGIAAGVGPAIHSQAQLREAVRSGLPSSTVSAMLDNLDLTGESMSRALALPRRTMARRRSEARLTPEESDRMYRLARTAAQAIEVLGSLDKATHWLRTPNRALGSVTPLDLMDTDIGVRQVEEVLGRIEYGVYS
jgi:putative toxin-antitoxin system antitoxin component (TIGR02293 family)